MTFEVKALKLIKHNKEVIFMKEVKQAIVLVDTYRRPSRKRNTVGRYIVSAKSEKEAIELVQKALVLVLFSFIIGNKMILTNS